jgi:GNAT superfamily N-acetyltransferase
MSMSARFRSMTIEDIPEAMQLKDSAGWNQTTADWARFLSASPEGCFVPEHEGRVVGTSTTILYEGRFAWIGMVIVDSQYRGQGIGTALLERAIRYLDSRNVPCMKLDATPQGKPLYEKLGFVSEYDIERWMLVRRPGANFGGKASTETVRTAQQVLGHSSPLTTLRFYTQSVENSQREAVSRLEELLFPNVPKFEEGSEVTPSTVTKSLGSLSVF